jgi:GT2 family glycosyltransferase
MRQNLSQTDHEILVYVENDNQDTVGFLKSQKEYFPHLKIIINPLPIPLGYARNINLMFEMAKHPIVSYIQSDMVLGPNYDVEILKHLQEDTIISATRIEPPLHPPSPEKITYDFGLDPKTFDLNALSAFAEKCKADKLTDCWFAPFTLYKKNWNNIGGHDTLFRRSREDSDLLYRFSMMGLKIKQTWNAIVYHFTCTSSRGIEWWTEKAKMRTQLQQAADAIEMQRFLRKWPSFKHDTTFNPETEYKYPISVNFRNASPRDYDLLKYYAIFNRIFIDNEETRRELQKVYGQFHRPANDLLNISQDNWEIYKKYYHTWEFNDIYSNNIITDDDIILNVSLNNRSFGEIFNKYPHIFHHLNDIIHANRNEEPGEFELDGVGTLVINKVVNKIKENIRVTNPPLNLTFQVI